MLLYASIYNLKCRNMQTICRYMQNETMLFKTDIKQNLSPLNKL